MASWTTVPDSSLEPGKPVRSIDILALRDNPIAIAEGASGAPRMSWPAVVDLMTTANVVVAWNNSTTTIQSNSTTAGSNLSMEVDAVVAENVYPFQKVTRDAPTGSTFPTGYATLSGTWRNIGSTITGRLYNSGLHQYEWYPSLWTRVA